MQHQLQVWRDRCTWSIGTIKKNRCPDRSDGIVSSLPHDRQTNHPTNQTDGHEGWQGSCALSLWRKRGRTKKCSRSFFECFFLTFWSLIYFYLVYTHWRRGKTEKDQSPEYYKIFRKNTIFNEHPVCMYIDISASFQHSATYWNFTWCWSFCMQRWEFIKENKKVNKKSEHETTLLILFLVVFLFESVFSWLLPFFLKSYFFS